MDSDDEETYRVEKRSIVLCDDDTIPQTPYDRSKYVETAKGDRISRSCHLLSPRNIVIAGKSVIDDGAVVRGDLAPVRMGRYCKLSEGSLLRPPHKVTNEGFTYYRMQIGSYVSIGTKSVVEAAYIGSNVSIGSGCVVGKRCILKDCCVLLDGAVLAPDSVVPPFSVFGGCPARFLEELPASFPATAIARALERYKKFRPIPK